MNYKELLGNREIKFRVWTKATGIWELVEIDDDYTVNSTDILINYFLGRQDEVITQFAGLKDKNGKEIYEGDVVDIHQGEGEQYGVVVFGKFESWHEGGCSRHHYHQGFHIIEKGGDLLLGDYREDIDLELIEVIGNIFKNPELIKKD